MAKCRSSRTRVAVAHISCSNSRYRGRAADANCHAPFRPELPVTCSRQRPVLNQAPYAMETPTESEFIEVKSPIDRFKEQWEAQPGSLNFFRQVNVINKNPQSLQYAGLSSLKGWTQPLVFAVLGLLL